MAGYSNGKSSSDSRHKAKVKEEPLDHDFPVETPYPRHVGENVASSSGSNMRSSLVGMGFLPSLVDKVIEENGEDDIDLLFERLLQCTDAQTQYSDSLDGLFGNKDLCYPQTSGLIQPKEEPDEFDEFYVDKRASLLMMNFSENEVDFALGKLGEDAPVNELVDFITAAQIAEELENEIDDSSGDDEERDQGVANETLFGTMDKTLHLLEMGFSESEISLAIEKFGAEIPILELADSILTGRIHCSDSEKFNLASLAMRQSGASENSIRQNDSTGCYLYDTENIKTEDFGLDAAHSRDIDLEISRKGKRPREENANDFPVDVSHSRQLDYDEIWEGKRPKDEEYMAEMGFFLEPPDIDMEEKVDADIARLGIPKALNSNAGKSVETMVAGPPYFFYGNVVNLSFDHWAKISKFLYGIEPEFVDTQLFSALIRREGYIHNLPTTNRFHILPRPPMTIQDAIPHTKNWWPSWDTRRQLSCISTEPNGIPQLCDRLGKMLMDSQGQLPSDRQRHFLYNCKMLNLIWVGRYKLAPLEPEQWERILGYPSDFTQAAENSSIERLQFLKNCFQIDTLGYHLSVLKSMFPGGLTVISIFSGIGGVEVTLHRLGIRLKGVVSVETSEPRRMILRRWWQTTNQTGELVEIEDIQKLTIKKLESLYVKFGGFDLVMCQNPSTPSKASSKMAANQNSSQPAFDFTLFHEFVRVLQRVKTMMERKR
ncbi:hypothetical protein SLA2020_092450 [Shorea laevis]